MKKLLYFIAIGFAMMACQSSTPNNVLVRNHGPAQGSTYNISYVAPVGIDFRQQIDSILFCIDQSMSLWDKHSTISKLNRGDTVKLDQHFLNVFRLSQSISRQTEGIFDISVAPISNYLGFGPDKKTQIDSAKIDSLQKFVGFKKLSNLKQTGALPKGMKIDMNAIAQGYTVDVIAEFLDNHNIKNYMVEVGGELRTRGKTIDKRTWVIGIDKPVAEMDTENRFQVIIKLDSAALATSGNYRKFWVDEKTGAKYVHTLNPKTGFPAKNKLLSATIIATNCATADAWATVCMAAGLDKAKQFVEENSKLDAYFVIGGKDGEWEIWQSPGFKKRVK